MLTYEQALEKILEKSIPLGAVTKELHEAMSYFLAETVVSPFPMPQFDNSAVDGYGVLCADLADASEHAAKPLKLSGEIQAGSTGKLSLSPGCAIKILTGAVVPQSVEAVVMREYCSEDNGDVSIGYAPTSGENIRRCGGEFPAGKEVISAGAHATPPVIGLLASLGSSSVKVHAKPYVSIIATGDELVAPGKPLEPGQIYNSNSYALASALAALGITAVQIMHAADTPEAARKAFEEALSCSDVVISTGGVSVGDYDYVKEVLEQLGIQTVFWRIAIKPGKPVYFGIQDAPRKLVFGLPGNPVSGLVTFHQFVRPALLKMMGSVNPENETAVATLKTGLKKKPGRLDFVRGIASHTPDGLLEVAPTVGQDSHMISGLAQADCLIHFGADDGEIKAGASVVITFLDWKL